MFEKLCSSTFWVVAIVLGVIVVNSVTSALVSCVTGIIVTFMCCVTITVTLTRYFERRKK